MKNLTDLPLDASLNVGCFDTYEEAVRDIRTIRREYRKRAIRIPADKNVIRATCDKPCLVTEIVHDVLRYKFYPEKGEVLGSRAVAYGMEHFARLRDEYFRTDPRYKGNTQSA